jgi:hypothetical protein
MFIVNFHFYLGFLVGITSSVVRARGRTAAGAEFIKYPGEYFGSDKFSDAYAWPTCRFYPTPIQQVTEGLDIVDVQIRLPADDVNRRSQVVFYI